MIIYFFNSNINEVNKMYKCPNCSKVYKHNGKWLRKHMIKICHVKILNPVELVEKNDIDLHVLIHRIEKIERKIINRNVHYYDTPIERVKQKQDNKITDPTLQKYRSVFKECINELKEVLKVRKEQIENDKELDISQLVLIN